MKKVFQVIVFLLFPFILQARMAQDTDFSYTVVKDTQINILTDYSFVTDEMFTFTVKNDEAKKHLSLFKFYFNPDEEEVAVDYAYVINGKERLNVDPKNIQRNNIASAGQGIVNRVEVAVPFSQIKTGSSVFLKLKTKSRPNVFGKLFSQKFVFGDRYLEMQNTITIKSPFELFFKVQDQSKVLTVHKSYNEAEKAHVLYTRLQGPFVNFAIEEMGVLPEAASTFMVVSTIKDWSVFREMIIAKLGGEAEKKLPQPLDDFMKTIPPTADSETKVNAILSFIASHFDYLGDWRNQGGFVPKSLEKTVKERFGDCKDFSTLLLAMLKHAGIKASYALVNRSYNPVNVSEDSIPSSDYFNHMIVRAEIDGKSYFIDPTNPYSVGLLKRADISERNAFILANDGPLFERIDSKEPRSLVTLAKTYQFRSATEATVSSKMTIKGEIGRLMMDGLKGKPKADVQKLLADSLADGDNYVLSKLENKNETSLAYKDIEVSAEMMVNKISENAEGKQSLNLPNVKNVLLLAQFRESDVGVFYARLLPDIKAEYVYKNLFFSGKTAKGCDMQTPWFNAKRFIEKKADGFVVRDFFYLKKNHLGPQDYTKNGYSSVVDDAINCFMDAKVEVSYGTKEHRDSSAALEKLFSDLTPAERKEKRFEIARSVFSSRGEGATKNGYTLDDVKVLLDKNLEEFPGDSESLRFMGLYVKTSNYISGKEYNPGSLAKAMTYFNKSIEADETNLASKIEKVITLLDMGAKEMAIPLFNRLSTKVSREKFNFHQSFSMMDAAYELQNKQVGDEFFELTLSRAKDNDEKSTAYSKRADYFYSTEQYVECIKDYSKAIELYDKNAWLYHNRSLCYTGADQFDEAIASSKKALTIMNFGAGRHALARAYWEKGYDLVKKGDFKKAEEFYNLSLLEVKDCYTYLLAADNYLRMKNVEKAKEARIEALKNPRAEYPVAQIDKMFQELFMKFGVQ